MSGIFQPQETSSLLLSGNTLDTLVYISIHLGNPSVYLKYCFKNIPFHSIPSLSHPISLISLVPV